MTAPTPGPSFDPAAIEARIEAIDANDTPAALDELNALTAALAAGLDPGRRQK